MARHHYVPAFLLREWDTNEDGQFVAYHYIAAATKVVENPRAQVVSACRIRNLNNFLGVDPSQRDFLEVGFFTPRVDTPAALALRVMRDKGIRVMTPKQRLDWCRLLISLGVRTPEALLEFGPAHTVDAFKALRASSRHPEETEQAIAQVVDANIDKFKRNFPRNAAMEICQDLGKLATIERMKWWTRRWPRPSILIGDRPLLTFPRMNRPNGIPLDNPLCLIALPVGPDEVFFASAHPKAQAKMRNMPLASVAAMLNLETIGRSHSAVYAADRSLAAFAMPRIEAKANGTWKLC